MPRKHFLLNGLSYKVVIVTDFITQHMYNYDKDINYTYMLRGNTAGLQQ